MNFVAQVEEHLRDLGTEARRKHPGEFECCRTTLFRMNLGLNNDIECDPSHVPWTCFKSVSCSLLAKCI